MWVPYLCNLHRHCQSHALSLFSYSAVSEFKIQLMKEERERPQQV